MANRATVDRRPADAAAAAAQRQRQRKSASLSSALTEERLRDHARRTAASAVSPYYRGLTDSALYVRGLGRGSPGRESVATSGSFSTTVIVQIQRWGSSFFSRKTNAAADKPPPGFPGNIGWEQGGRKTSPVPPQEKPLRERYPALPPPRPRKASLVSPETERGTLLPVVLPDERGSRERNPVPAPLAPETEIETEKSGPDVGIGGMVEDCSCRKSPHAEERQYKWGCKYRPQALEEFICNRIWAEELRQLAIKRQCGHFIFEGPPGVGKRTMVLAMLREAFGAVKLKTKNELKKIVLKGEVITSIDVNVKISSQHVEVNLSEVCGYEKHVIIALMNESHSPFDKASECNHTNCRVIVLHDAEKVSTDGQHLLRWLMEKYRGCNRIVFCCSDASKLQAIKHLCKLVTLQPPSDNEIVEVLEFIAKKEHIELPHHVAEKIAENSKHNLRQAIRSFEASWNSSYSFKENQKILTGWEEDIAIIAKSIIEEQSPKQLYTIRGKLKNLIEHNVSPDFIFSTLIFELRKHLDSRLQTKLEMLYQEYNIQDNEFFMDAYKSAVVPHSKHEDPGNKSDDSRKNARQFMRIEEFAAKFMSFYKSAMAKSIGEMNTH